MERILLGLGGAAGHYRLIIERNGSLDELLLECEPAADADRDSLRARAEHQLGEETGLRIIVAVLDPGSLPRSDGKAVRVVARRPR